MRKFASPRFAVANCIVRFPFCQIISKKCKKIIGIFNKFLTKEDCEALEAFKALEAFDHDSIYNCVCETAQKNEKKANEYFQIIRFAVSGQAGGPDLFPMLEVFGKDKVIQRMTAFINA